MNTDILVLGAGPAGIAISLLMARQGYSVEILDAAFFPRTKICGEFLNPQAVRWLQENDLLKKVEELEPFPIYGMRLTDHAGRAFAGTYRSGKGYAIKRMDFDALLVSLIQNESILLQQGFRADRLIFDGDRAVGISGIDSTGASVEKRARVLIGADGRGNLIGRTFSWMKAIRSFRKYAFLTYFQNVKELQNYGEIHLVKNGYAGVAPLQSNLANVALVIDEKNCPAGDLDLTAFLLANLEGTSLYGRLTVQTPLCPVITAGPLAYTLRRTSGHGTILIGDTCGFLDPFTGEGINYALVSATIAASVLEECFRSNCFDDSVLRNYDRQRKQILGRKFQMARLIQTALHSKTLSDFLIQKFAKQPRLADTIVSAVGSAIPVDEVWNPAFLWKVVFG